MMYILQIYCHANVTMLDIFQIFCIGYDGEAYILTTDADVRFTPDSVEALLDLMTRDLTVGAVCARTHPAGSGPIIWFQMFEYALGHWFQKVRRCFSVLHKAY